MSATGGFWRGLRGDLPPHDLPFLAAEPPLEPGQPRHLALVLAYEGDAFAGWQVQPGARTVQGVVEEALSRLCDHQLRVHGSGRTDAGVHALGQTASFITSSRLPLDRMLAGLKALLPPSIHVRELGPVAAGFHARYSARAKTYHYYLWPTAGPALFLGQRLWPLAHGLDQGAVAAALALLPGQRDLKAFASQGAEAKGSTQRTIHEADLKTQPDGIWCIRLTASGFLRHVVRNLVGSLAQVGQGRLAPEAIMEMLRAGRRLYPGPKAPPHGLYLNRVYYQRYEAIPHEEREA